MLLDFTLFFLDPCTITGTGSISHSNSEYNKYTRSKQKPWTTFTRLRTINQFAFLLFYHFLGGVLNR